MKQSQEEYIAKNIGTKTARQIADELGLRERSVSKYLRKMGLREGKPSGQRLRQEEDEKAPVIKKMGARLIGHRNSRACPCGLLERPE